MRTVTEKIMLDGVIIAKPGWLAFAGEHRAQVLVEEWLTRRGLRYSNLATIEFHTVPR